MAIVVVVVVVVVDDGSDGDGSGGGGGGDYDGRDGSSMIRHIKRGKTGYKTSILSRWRYRYHEISQVFNLN